MNAARDASILESAMAASGTGPPHIPEWRLDPPGAAAALGGPAPLRGRPGGHVAPGGRRRAAKADYDGNGKVEGVQDETKGLLLAVWKGLEAKGWKQSTGSPYGTAPANADAKQKAAFYNFLPIYGVMWTADASGKIGGGNEGKAAAMHNFKRTCALLQLSLKDLNGALPTGAADCTK